MKKLGGFEVDAHNSRREFVDGRACNVADEFNSVSESCSVVI